MQIRNPEPSESGYWLDFTEPPTKGCGEGGPHDDLWGEEDGGWYGETAGGGKAAPECRRHLCSLLLGEAWAREQTFITGELFSVAGPGT